MKSLIFFEEDDDNISNEIVCCNSGGIGKSEMIFIRCFLISSIPLMIWKLKACAGKTLHPSTKDVAEGEVTMIDSTFVANNFIDETILLQIFSRSVGSERSWGENNHEFGTDELELIELGS